MTQAGNDPLAVPAMRTQRIADIMRIYERAREFAPPPGPPPEPRLVDSTSTQPKR